MGIKCNFGGQNVNQQSPNIVKTLLKKKFGWGWSGGSALADIKIYKIRVIKARWHWHKYTQTDQQNIQSQETDPHK